MSFSADVKNECSRISEMRQCCEITETAAFLRAAGKLLLGGNSTAGVSVVSGNAAIVRRYYSIIKQISGCAAEIIVARGVRLNKANRYELRVAPSASALQLLKSLGMLQECGFSNNAFLAKCIVKSCCRKALLRGFFLGAGSLSSPKGDYHLEITVQDYDAAQLIVRALKTFGVQGKIAERKDFQMVYLKEADAIIDFLRVIGAANSVLRYENERVVKDMRNRVNREVNCETANLHKTVETANRQIEKIKRLIAVNELEKLPLPLRITAETRLNNPEASIGELVTLIGCGVTKSGINHRLRKLESIADAL